MATLLAIGAAESGHYRVKYMLRNNNAFGMMNSGHRLIRYNNMELGVLTYVRMMSRNYYGIGLTTLEQIGRKYCPVMESGVRKASPHWLNLVRNAKKVYNDYTDTITLSTLLNLEED